MFEDGEFINPAVHECLWILKRRVVELEDSVEFYKNYSSERIDLLTDLLSINLKLSAPREFLGCVSHLSIIIACGFYIYGCIR